jgi:hypothetical protein
MKRLLIAPLILLLGLLAGCGGGGAGGATAFGPMFITDDLGDHDHVWVTVHRVSLAGNGGVEVVYDNPAGASVDLASLQDATGGRFAFCAMVPEGVYTSVTFTLDKDLVLFEQGSSTGLDRVFAGHNGTTVDITLTFASPRMIGPGNPLVIDFDLENWDDDGTTVTGSPFIAEGDGDGLDDMDRHEDEEIEGVIEGLSGTAPDQSFTLQLEHGGSVTVVTDANTDICGSGTLADGLEVEVEGAFSTTPNAFVASSIEIEDEDDDDDDLPEVEGAAFDISIELGTFSMTVLEAEHFLPPFDTVIVVTDGSTEFTNVNGDVVTAAEFFLALMAGDVLEVEGEFDAGTNTLLAHSVSYDDEEGDDD